MEPQDGGGGGSGGVDVVTFMHALGKVLVVKIIVKLVATILALLILPKIKDKKKRKPNGHKPHHRPQAEEEEDEDEEDEEDEEEEDDDDEERRAARGGARAIRTALLHSIETSSWDPRLLDLASRVFQGIHRWTPSEEADDGDSADAWTADARPPTLAS
ncbi:uncharacterized protein [Hetaerina americana]|uniref:uncharacterized protein n=1 Tax=Hetaerina americana TaxID=62018 RepID=UPI003A7F34B6